METPLYMVKKIKKILKILLEKGADINAANQAGRTLLHFACNKKDINIVKVLIEYGVNVNLADLTKETPFIGQKTMRWLTY